MSGLASPLATPLGGYSWTITGGLGTPNSQTSGGGLFDQEIDMMSLDFIDTPDGEWSEIRDSRSIVLCQLELELGQSYSTPGDGTTIAEKFASGDPITTSDVEADCRRALAILERAVTIGSVKVSGRDELGRQLVDESGRATFELTWIDLATGSPVGALYRPLGG